MDIRKYIGIPFKDHACGFDGCDCYGLVRLIYREELGLELPYLGDRYSHAFKRLEIGPMPGKAVSEGWAVDVTSLPVREFDVLVFARGGIEYHLGIAIDDYRFLHVIDGTDACVEHFASMRWVRRFKRRLRHANFLR